MSYSHAADGKLAPALQRAIQQIGKPWYRRPAIRVFRDETSLSANPGPWSAIRAALEQCEYFLLMCSPLAVASPWVTKEVEWWLANRPVQRILLVITDGAVAWDPAVPDFDWGKTTCVPRVLAGRFTEEPYYIDLRWAHDQTSLSSRNVRFRTAALTIASTLRGVAMEDLESEDLRQQRRLRVIALCTAAIVCALAILAFVSQRSSRIALQQAQWSSRMADSRSVAAKASGVLAEHGDLHQAIVLAVLAWRLSPTDEAAEVMTRLANTSTDVARILGQHSTDGVDVKAFTIDADGTPLLVTTDYHGILMFWRIPSGALVGSPLATAHTNSQQLLFSSDGAKMLGVEGSADKPGSVVLWDIRSRTSRTLQSQFPAKTFGSDISPGGAALSPAGRYVALFDNGYMYRGRSPVAVQTIAVWDTVAGNVALHTLTLPSRLFALSFLDENRLLLLAAPPTENESLPGNRFKGPFASIWDRSSNQLQIGPRTVEKVRLSGQNSVLFNADSSRMLLFGYEIDPLTFYQREADLSLRAITLPEYASTTRDEVYNVALTARGDRVAASGHDHLSLWDLSKGVLLKTDTGISSGVLSRDGRWFASRNSGIGSHITVRDLEKATVNAASLDASCKSDEHGMRCMQLLCEKATPLLNDDDVDLRTSLGEAETDRLTRLALSRPCKNEQSETWMPPGADRFLKRF